MQTIPLDRYIEMVKTFGIEEAYNQRFRGTGRTVRDILNLAVRISAGDKIMIIADGRPGNTFNGAIEVMYAVRRTLEQLGLVCFSSASLIRNPHNGGELRIYGSGDYTRGLRHAEYRLHDC